MWRERERGGDREGEMEKSGAIWRMEQKWKTIMQMFQPSKTCGSVCVCVAHLLLMWNVNQTITFQDLNQPAVSKGAD